MGLEEPSKHISDKEGKINQFTEKPGFFSSSGSDLSAWAAFRDSSWGQELAFLGPQEKLKLQGNIEVEEDHESLSNVGPATRRPIVEIPGTIPNVWRSDSSHILVRSEYEEAELAALVANKGNINAFLVGGQSGIGKSVFLIWLLMRRLALKLPTALQVEEEHAMLFHDGGTSQFTSLASAVRYMGLEFDDPSSRIWALVDSSQLLSEPAPIFRASGPFFVVEAASRRSCFEWAERVHHRYFYMKTWTFSEVLQVRPFMGLSLGGPHEESKLGYLYDTYRASPRALARYANMPDEYEGRVAQEVEEIDLDTLQSALRSPDSDSPSHLITRVEPSPISRSRYQKTIASQGVLELLWHRYLKNSAAEAKHFYNIFQGNSVTASAAGWIFELRIHHLFRQSYYLISAHIGRGTSTSPNFDVYDNYTPDRKWEEQELQLWTSRSEEYPLVEGIELQVDRYYRPAKSYLPTIDSLNLVHHKKIQPSPILFMFQIMYNKEKHVVKEFDMEKVGKLVLPLNTRKYYVVVTRPGIKPKIEVPKGSCFKEVKLFHHSVHDHKLFPF